MGYSLFFNAAPGVYQYVGSLTRPVTKLHAKPLMGHTPYSLCGKLLPFNEPFYCVCWQAPTAAPTEGYAKGEQKRAAGAALFFKNQYVTSLPMGQS